MILFVTIIVSITIFIFEHSTKIHILELPETRITETYNIMLLVVIIVLIGFFCL